MKNRWSIVLFVALVVLIASVFALVMYNIRSVDIHDAVRRGNVNKVKSILAKRPELINAKDNDGNNPLHVAAAWGYKNIVELLIAKGAYVNAKGNWGMIPLHLAAGEGLKEIVELLISRGADVNTKAVGNSDQTPLHLAAAMGHKEVVDVLISKGGQVNSTNEFGATPLHEAAGSKRYKGTIQVLIANGADVKAKNEDGATPLEEALPSVRLSFQDVEQKSSIELKDFVFIQPENLKDSIKTVKLLLSNGADANTKDYLTGQPILLDIVLKGQKELVHVFLLHGADVNAKGKDNITALHVAALRGNKEIVELLLSYGADVNTKADNDETPLWSAKYGKHKEIVELLRKHGAMDKD